MRFRSLVLLTLTLPLAAGAATIDFSREIRPILSENCFFCHGPDEAKREANLRFDVESDAKKNNDGTTAVVPGHPEKSALIDRITTTNPDDVMPPPKLHKTITPAQVALLKEWIKQGAKWGKHWSYEKVVRPVVSAWSPRPRNGGTGALAEIDSREAARRVSASESKGQGEGGGA